MPPTKRRPPKKGKKGKNSDNKQEEKVEEAPRNTIETPADRLTANGIIATYAQNSKSLHRNTKDINVSNLSVSFHGAVLVDDAELVLNYGNRYALIGRNGCGKSTLMRVIASRAVPLPEGIDLYYLSEEIEASEISALEAVMAVDEEREQLEKEQDMLHELMAEDDSDELIERLEQILERLDELDAATAEARASAILRGLGFSKKMQAMKTREFSGGWRMRIALARALFIQPVLLLLDEPTNHLDLEAVVWLEEYLSNWKKILFMVSHSQDFMNTVCSHVVHFHSKGLDYYTGNYDMYVQTRAEVEENQMKRYNWEQDQIKQMKEYIARFGHGTAKLARQAQSKEKTLAKMVRGGLTEKVQVERVVNFRFPDPGSLPTPVLQFQSITFAYPECEPLYENVDFGVDLDSRIALVGPNGAGKSTLLKLMTGALVPTIGNVRPHSHLRLSMFTQHFIDILDLTMTPLDYMLQEYPNKTREDMRKFLGRFGASGGIQTQIMGHLSDGQKSRVVFAKIAMETPHLLLLDEPTNHLDMESIDSLAEAINHFEGGMMLVSHDMRLISQVAKEIWICDNKTITRYNGDIDDFKMHLRKEMPKPS
mmetsp:Transcript_7419/g.11194  ORF Transcript_7419/g.11194 Transcript_7419/m.11194 type:complete len:596 (-) Transcript_7419:344-2131(-)